MEDKQKRILIVDDEEDICEILQYNLKKVGYYCQIAFSAEEALYKLKDHFDIMILDIMMGGISGLKLANLLRNEYHNNIPIIFISALGKENDILNGFSNGCDDYICKPFSIKEVIARVNAILLRYNDNAHNYITDSSPIDTDQKTYTYKDLHIDFIEKRVYIKGIEVILTKKENEILILLTKNLNKTFSRDDILKLVWKDESCVLDRTIDVHIARLRKKLEIYGDMIINRSGYGYCFQG